MTAIRNASQKAENQGQQERMEKRAKENPRPRRSPAPRPQETEIILKGEIPLQGGLL